MQHLRQNLLIAGLICIVTGATISLLDESLLPFGATIGIFGMVLFLWGFSTKPGKREMSKEEIDAWQPNAESLPDAGRVMYRVDTTLYEPKKTTVLCGSCGHVSEIDGGRPSRFDCQECGTHLWEDPEEE